VSERWVVAMSGGVDSSVAAALLVKQGLDVVGITMDLGEAGGSARGGRCCGLPEAEDARAVARRLGIRHYTVDYREAFHAAVVAPFVESYAAGRTPIPCVACNRVLKFDVLLRRARALGARGVATGHYVRCAHDEAALYRPRDRGKDQSYFLFDTPRERLAALRFPLGELQKSEVRAIARELRLETADKPESQDICFVPDGDVRAALGRLEPGLRSSPGEIVDRGGRVLGTHAGTAGYTAGQRRGLGLADGPWYVAEVQPESRRLVVDRASALMRRRVWFDQPSWLVDAPPAEVRVQVRHRQRSVPARLLEAHGDGDGRWGVELPEGEGLWAPAPGQAAVLYDRDDRRLLGGGWIVGSD